MVTTVCVGVYSVWERVHHVTSLHLSSTEQTLAHLHQFETELFQLRTSLRKDAARVRSSGRREGSCDSGISDASTENELPLREQQLERLRYLASSLEQSLDPRSKACSMITKTIETTSYQLKDLQISFQRLKSSKQRGGKLKVGPRPDQNRFRQKSAGNPRRRRVAKMALVVHLLMMLVMFISWMTQPRCCDNIASLSMVPQLKYVNGPPPI